MKIKIKNKNYYFNNKYQKNLKQRLLSHRKIDHQTNCWEWTGSRKKYGYGQICISKTLVTHMQIRTMLSTHVVAAILFLKFNHTCGLFVLHHCDNPPCFNPKHLFVGTHKDNMHDSVIKGKHKNNIGNSKGSNNIKAKLTEIQVLEIRNEIEKFANKYGPKARGIGKLLALKYKVEEHTICNIKNRKRWKHV